MPDESQSSPESPGIKRVSQAEHERTIESLREAASRLAKAQEALRGEPESSAGKVERRRWDRKWWEERK
jgi:hypothetical protein